MAKININFNGSTYQLDESSLSTATTALQSHLSTTMSGSGATVELGGTTYNIDSTKLTSAKNAFISHLGTIAGEGTTVTVDGVEYNVDSTKLTDAISGIEEVFCTIGEEILEGDGAEYYTMAPTALSFRSSAPLSELQDVQVNGETVDPSNYTLEEGSTIVTFSIDYLKTLDVGNYEVVVASDSQTAKGGFTVVTPELNERGFYYNQPYAADVAGWGRVVFFIREDGTYDLINGYGAITTNTYTVDGNSVVALDENFGAFHCTISSDGTEIYCAEIQTALKVSSDTSIAADEDYIYIYNEDLGGYEVKVIDKTKSEYGAIKTGINDIDTVSIEESAFGHCTGLTSITIPDSVTSIGERAFAECVSLKSITIPDSVTSIGERAFVGCVSLKSITIPDSVTSIGDYAFMDSNLNTVVLKNGVTNIGECLFKDCDLLTSIEIPSSVISIGSGAFYACRQMMTIIYSGTMLQWEAIDKGTDWDWHTGAKLINSAGGFSFTYGNYIVQCSDGTITP